MTGMQDFSDTAVRIVAVDGDPNAVPHIEASHVTLTKCSSVASAAVVVEELQPHAVIVEASLRGARDFVRWIKRRTGSIVLVSSSRPFMTDAWGADGHIEKPLTVEGLQAALQRLSLDIQDARPDVELFSDSIEELEFKDPPETAWRPASDAGIHVVAQEVIAVWGAKGGAGRTVVAANLAARLEGLKVLLIDLNFSEGPTDLAVYLKLPPTPHIGKILDEPADRRQGFLNTVIERDDLPFDVIQPPPTLEQAEGVTADDIVDVIDQARRRYQIVILDLPADQTLLTLEAADMATSILFVTQVHNGSIARLEALKDQLRRDVPKMLVINRFSEKAARAREMAHFLDMPVAAIIVEDSGLDECMRKGTLLIDFYSLFSQGIADIGQTLLGLKKAAPKQRWGLANLFKAR